MNKRMLILMLVVTAIGSTSPVAADVPTSPGPIKVPGFWLTGTFTANPTTYSGLCFKQFTIVYTGMLTGTPGAHVGYRFIKGYVETPPVYATMTAQGIPVSDHILATAQPVSNGETWVEKMEILVAPVPPSKDPILWTTKTAKTFANCRTRPPQPTPR
jgi:hypothetical protein